MAKKRRKRNRRSTRSTIFMVLFLTLLGFAVYYGININNKIKERNTLQRKLVKLQQEEVDLKNDYKKLRNPDYVARYAREKYMYSKEDELIIKLED